MRSVGHCHKPQRTHSSWQKSKSLPYIFLQNDHSTILFLKTVQVKMQKPPFAKHLSFKSLLQPSGLPILSPGKEHLFKTPSY